MYFLLAQAYFHGSQGSKNVMAKSTTDAKHIASITNADKAVSKITEINPQFDEV